MHPASPAPAFGQSPRRKFLKQTAVTTVVIVIPIIISAVFPGCVSPVNSARIDFPNTTINDQPVHLILDTGSGTALIFRSTAERLGVKSTPNPNMQLTFFIGTSGTAFTEPVQLAVDGQTFNVSLAVADLSGKGFNIDGAIGFDDIKDNILVFDSITRTIRGVEKLPSDINQWVRFKIYSGQELGFLGALVLETPLPNGHTGLIQVDTGSYNGVVLPPTTWAQWETTNSHVRTDKIIYNMPLKYVLAIPDCTWADKLTIGPLTLTTVPVSKADWRIPSDDYLGTFGLAALERLDMVLDGENGFAYLRPKASDSAPPSFQSWTIDPTVRLSDKHILAFAALNCGLTKSVAGDFADAIAEYNQVLEVDSGDLEVLKFRGLAKNALGDYSGAQADFSRVLERDRGNARAYESRAATRQEQGDFEEAVADYNKCIELNPDNSFYPRLLRQLLQLRL